MKDMKEWPHKVSLITGVLVGQNANIIEGANVLDYASRGDNHALKLGWTVTQTDPETGKVHSREVTQWFDLRSLCIYRVIPKEAN